VKEMAEESVIIDATNMLAGRLASRVAKLSLQGRHVIILNVEKAVISGKKMSVLEEFRRRLRTRTLGSQRTAPVHPKRPDRIMRRIVRGMLPWDRPKGKEAFRRVEAYVGWPDEFKGKAAQKFGDADASRLRCKHVTLGEISEEIGGVRL